MWQNLAVHRRLREYSRHRATLDAAEAYDLRRARPAAVAVPRGTSWLLLRLAGQDQLHQQLLLAAGVLVELLVDQLVAAILEVRDRARLALLAVAGGERRAVEDDLLAVEWLAGLADREPRRARVVPEGGEQPGLRGGAAGPCAARGLAALVEREVGLEEPAVLHHLLRALAGRLARRAAAGRIEVAHDGPLALEGLEELLSGARTGGRFVLRLGVLGRRGGRGAGLGLRRLLRERRAAGHREREQRGPQPRSSGVSGHVESPFAAERSRSPGSDLELVALARRDQADRGAAARVERVPDRGDDLVGVVVGVVLVVVEGDEAPDAGGDRRGCRVLVRREAAVAPRRLVGGPVGGVVEQHVGAAEEGDGGGIWPGAVRLPDVGGVDERAPGLGDPERERGGRAMRVLVRGDRQAIDDERRGEIDRMDLELRREVLEGLERREVGVHLALEDVLEHRRRAAGAPDGERVAGDEHRREEPQALDVVPVGVREQDRGAPGARSERAGEQRVAQVHEPGAHVDDE